jgi:flavin-dependent dehydrogenase
MITAKHQVVIVGGGTAGITVAARLMRKGYRDVAVIERRKPTTTKHCGRSSAAARRRRRPRHGPRHP